MKFIPESVTELTLQALIKVLIKSLPANNYDPENMELRSNHILGVKILTMFAQMDKRFACVLQPLKNQIQRLNLARMLRSQDSEVYETAINMMRFITREGESFFPENLFAPED